MLLLVLIIEIAVPNNPTLGGMLLLAVLFATWLLPTPFAAAITALAVGRDADHRAHGRSGPAHRKIPVRRRRRDRMPQRADRSLTDRSRPSAAGDHRPARRFTADAAHELRNPLSALQSDLEITLLQPRTPDELTATVRLALKNTQRLVKISESLLTLSAERCRRPDAPRSRAIDISDVLEEAYARWEGHATALGVHLNEQLDCEGVVEGDALLLGRLFDNLLENALGYTPRGGVVTLALAASPPGSCAVSITDTGPGIPASAAAGHLRALLTRRRSRSRRTGGAGLGLAICAAIVSAHKGTITLDDEYVVGTRIVVRLPVTKLSGRV